MVKYDEIDPSIIIECPPISPDLLEGVLLSYYGGNIFEMIIFILKNSGQFLV